MGAEPHLNTCALALTLTLTLTLALALTLTLTLTLTPSLCRCFRHFVLFVLEFELIDARVRPYAIPTPALHQPYASPAPYSPPSTVAQLAP